ncbi:hypothetical protein LC593_17030 [Nostoc sp. CHAB 5844]|nr:hypothetical protein [Nostoc sp. CHAB 5844]
MKIKLPIVYYNWVRGQEDIVIGTPEWQEWLATRKSFNYQDASGSFTCKQRNNGSWIAQRTVHNRKRQVYIGTTLTLENLQQARQK